MRKQLIFYVTDELCIIILFNINMSYKTPYFENKRTNLYLIINNQSCIFNELENTDKL